MLKAINSMLSFILELAMLFAFGYAGFHWGRSGTGHFILGIGIPALIIIFWSRLLAPNSKKRLGKAWVMIISIVLFGLSAVALYFSGVVLWAIILGIATLINAAVKLATDR